MTPVGDTKPSTPLDGVVKLVPGTYAFVFEAPGSGLQRFSLNVGADETRTVQVPAPANLASAASGTDVPLAADPDSGSRFTELRKFAVQACLSNCSAPTASWVRFYTSPHDAFPGLRPRPVAPGQSVRAAEFDVY